MLTKKQRDLLMFIHECLKQTGVPPSFDEMCDAVNLRSKSGVHRLVTALVERGYLTRLPHRARALEVRRLPEDILNASKPSKTNASSTKKDTPVINTFEIPLYGSIAAGTPIEAIRHDGPMVQIPQDMIGHGDYYALTIDGDSMINAGIHDGDTVIIKRCENAENGTIIVALVDDENVTLKRLRRAGNKIVLEPENEKYEPQILDPVRVQIQGRLAGLIRTYH